MHVRFYAPYNFGRTGSISTPSLQSASGEAAVDAEKPAFLVTKLRHDACRLFYCLWFEKRGPHTDTREEERLLCGHESVRSSLSVSRC